MRGLNGTLYISEISRLSVEKHLFLSGLSVNQRNVLHRGPQTVFITTMLYTSNHSMNTENKWRYEKNSDEHGVQLRTMTTDDTLQLPQF